MKTEKIITGFLIGLTAGAVLGILFAPGKGADTRKKIATEGKDLKNKIHDLMNEIADCYKRSEEEPTESV
jgi:gas vesicle protein